MVIFILDIFRFENVLLEGKKENEMYFSRMLRENRKFRQSFPFPSRLICFIYIYIHIDEQYCINHIQYKNVHSLSVPHNVYRYYTIHENISNRLGDKKKRNILAGGLFLRRNINDSTLCQSAKGEGDFFPLFFPR